MGDKTTIMVLNVDLQCCSCYKKVKKILSKFPQIRNQVYDEKKNTVTISVVCCDPEKLRDKLCSKGCGVIKSIEIKKPPPPPPKPRKEDKGTQTQPPPPQKDEGTQTQPPPPQKDKGTQTQPPPPQKDEGTQTPPGYCCGQCYEGHTWGPCYQLYGRPFPPPPCYHYCGCSYGPCGYGRRCYVISCDQYFLSDENATACSIM